MIHCDLNTSLPDWIIDHPESERVFKLLELDTSCEGKSLEYVCRQRGLEPQEVLRQLRRAVDRPDCDT